MSPRAAWRLEALGFDAVYDYVTGKADWTAAGLPTQGTQGWRGLPAFIATDVVTAQPEELVGTVLARATAQHADRVVIINDERVVLGRPRPPLPATRSDEPVGAVMEEGPTTVRADEDPTDLLQRMTSRNVREVLVTDPQGHLLGVIARTALEALDAAAHAPTP